MSLQLQTYIQEFVSAETFLSNFMNILLSFYSLFFYHYDYLCDTLHLANLLHAIPCLMSPSHSFLNDAVYKVHWDATKNTPCLIVNPPQISILSNMDPVLIKNYGIVEQVVDALKLELYEQNIGGGYNN